MRLDSVLTKLKLGLSEPTGAVKTGFLSGSTGSIRVPSGTYLQMKKTVRRKTENTIEFFCTAAREGILLQKLKNISIGSLLDYLIKLKNYGNIKVPNWLKESLKKQKE